MKGENGQGWIRLALTEFGPLLTLLDGDGNSIWSAPTKASEMFDDRKE